MKIGRKYKELTKNTVFFSISNVGTKLISFLLVPLYTYVLSPSEYGTVDILNTTIALLVPLLTVNIQDAVLRFALDKEYQPNHIISSGVKLVSFSSLIFACVLLVLKIFELLPLEWKYCLYLIYSFSSTSFQNIFSLYLRAKNKIATAASAAVLSALVACGLNLFFLLYLKAGIIGYLSANMIASLIGCLYCFFFGKICREVKESVRYDVLKKMLLYSAPLIVNSLAWWLNDASDRYILTFFSGISITGIYAVAYKIPTILSVAQGVFYNAWSVSAIKEYDPLDKDGFVGNVYSIYSYISLIICSLIMIGNPIISRMLYSKDFYDAWKYVPALLVGVLFNGLALFEGCLFTAVKRTKDVSRTTLVGAAVNTILNITLIPFFGAYGAAIATLIGYLTVWLRRTLTVKKLIDIKMDWKNQIFGMLLLVIQGILASLGSKTTVYQILCLIVLLLTQRKLIKKAVSTFL